MVTLTNKSKILIVGFVIVALIVVAVPAAVYALPTSDSNLVGASRTLVAKGVDRQVVDGQTVTVPANFTLNSGADRHQQNGSQIQRYRRFNRN